MKMFMSQSCFEYVEKGNGILFLGCVAQYQRTVTAPSSCSGGFLLEGIHSNFGAAGVLSNMSSYEVRASFSTSKV